MSDVPSCLHGTHTQLPVSAIPTRVPDAAGQYVFAADPPPRSVHHIRMIRGTPLGTGQHSTTAAKRILISYQ